MIIWVTISCYWKKYNFIRNKFKIYDFFNVSVWDIFGWDFLQNIGVSDITPYEKLVYELWFYDIGVFEIWVSEISVKNIIVWYISIWKYEYLK